MKMRIIVFCAAALLITSFANAQSARIEAGLNLANVSITDDGKVDEAKMLTSFRLGVIGDFHLGSIVYLQPGILYTGKGTKTQSADPSSANYSKATSNPSYIEVPVNLVFKTPAMKNTRFFFGAGPYMAVG